jgi:hypothetical protein
MMEEEPRVSADEAIKRSWSRLRRAHLHRTENPAARRWEEIGEMNHFAAAAAAAFKREQS